MFAVKTFVEPNINCDLMFNTNPKYRQIEDVRSRDAEDLKVIFN